jgi:protein tyrosine phosphatase (PTP) superfamily phosphohydrolase (DUF442 family)
MDPIEHIQSFLEISPELLTAGQPFIEQLQAIKDAGCEVVVNLATPESPDAIPDEAGRVNALGLEYIAIPVVWDAPRTEDLQTYFEALQRNRGRKVFVHCARNMRVSAFTYLYRMLILGSDPDECRADMHRIWEPNPTWAAFIDASLSSFRTP